MLWLVVVDPLHSPLASSVACPFSIVVDVVVHILVAVVAVVDPVGLDRLLCVGASKNLGVAPNLNRDGRGHSLLFVCMLPLSLLLLLLLSLGLTPGQ
jgi:hypothetical protein